MLLENFTQFNKWVAVFDTCNRVMEDIKFVLSHSVVAKYVTHERSDIVKVWLQNLSLLQGMNPQKRETSIHIEEEHENTHLPFVVCNSIASTHLLLVKSAFSAAGCEGMDTEASFEREEKDTDDGYSQRHAKVGRLSEESSICSSAAESSISESSPWKFVSSDDFVVPPSVLQLLFESTKAIDGWLAGSNIVSHVTGDISYCKLSAFKEALLRVKMGMYISGLSDGSSVTKACPIDSRNVDKDVSKMETETSSEKDVLSLLSSSEWPDIDYDVSSQEISVHMPLQGLLCLILKEALRHYCGESELTDKGDITYLNPLSSVHLDFFRKVLRGCHPYGFSAFMMEHPLRSRVFCSQVRAGMWRKNGDAAILCFNWYRSIRWYVARVFKYGFIYVKLCLLACVVSVCIRAVRYSAHISRNYGYYCMLRWVFACMCVGCGCDSVCIRAGRYYAYISRNCALLLLAHLVLENCSFFAGLIMS